MSQPAPVASIRRLYRLTFRTPDRRPDQGPSIIEVMAIGRADAIARMGLDLDAIGVREWTLVSCEVAS